MEAVENCALCAVVVRCVRWVLGFMLCMLLAVEGRLCLLKVLEVPEVMRCVPPCMLEIVEGGFCLLEVMRRVLLYMLEVVEGELFSLEVLEMPEVMCCVLLRSLEVLDALEAPKMPEVMRCVRLRMLEVPEMMCCVLLCLLEVSEVLEVMRSVLGTLHAGGCGGFEISIVWHFFSLRSATNAARRSPYRRHFKK